MNATKLRAWWSCRQGLDGTLEGATPAQVLGRCGWSRSVGGVGPYLTLFARAGTSRAAADLAVAELEIHELPTARGCTYVLPRSEFALGLRVGRDFAGGDLAQAHKLGVTQEEIDKLCAAVTKALVKGALEPDRIREATGTASRSLGEAGKKKGITTTLPLALGLLQARGEIRRVPTNGRLDQQRYQYALWKGNPLAQRKGDLDHTFTQLARRYFTWVGPATLAEFGWFCGLGKKATQTIVAPLELVPVEPGSDRLLLPEDVEAWKKFTVPKKPHYTLVSALDPIAANRRDVNSFLDAKDRERGFPTEGSFASGGSLVDLPSHAIFDRGRLVGLWEYDAIAHELVAATFVPRDKALEAAIQRAEVFVRDQLGDARSFSLDSPKSRAPKVEALRRMAGQI